MSSTLFIDALFELLTNNFFFFSYYYRAVKVFILLGLCGAGLSANSYLVTACAARTASIT